MEGVIIVVLAEMLGGDQHLQVIGGLEQHAAADRIGVTVIDVFAGELVHAVAVAFVVLARDPDHELVGDERAADRAFQRQRVVVAVGGAGIAAEFFGRALGDQVDRACGRAAPVQRALRPTQHLDPVDVVEARQLRRWPGDQRSVLQEGDGPVRAQVDAG